VFGVGGDPVKLGLVTSLNRPGGNATGVNFFTNELTAKRVQLLREIVPAAKRIALLLNPADPINESLLRMTGPAGKLIPVGSGMTCTALTVASRIRKRVKIGWASR
jgi:ABC-type uncharacterized transport system substrate-binding protein